MVFIETWDFPGLFEIFRNFFKQFLTDRMHRRPVPFHKFPWPVELMALEFRFYIIIRTFAADQSIDTISIS
jgi:hypothetical protein